METKTKVLLALSGAVAIVALVLDSKTVPENVQKAVEDLVVKPIEAVGDIVEEAVELVKETVN
jgi:hypothetical protein